MNGSGTPYAMQTWGANFIEVGVDRDLGVIRLRRVVARYSAGKIVNPLTARSQMIGSIIWDWGKATMEASIIEPNHARFLAKNLSNVAVPVNADIPSAIDVGFIDEHRQEFGVEPICRVLQVAPSTYYAAKKRVLAPSARAVRDAVMMQVLMVLWVANRKVYGAHKLWKAARRAGHDIGRDQVARLMRVMEIEGISRRRRKVFTTIADPDAVRAPDLVNRNFTADRPDALWVTDLTYVPTHTGMAYVCFIVDAFSRRIVGWRVAANMRTEMVLDALEMARRSRGGRRVVGQWQRPRSMWQPRT
jgi:hypothetical protein